MALHWDLSKIKDQEHLWEHREEGNQGPGDYLNRTTHDLIWACLTYDMRGITKDNIDEWLFRQAFSEQVSGPYRMKQDDKGNPMSNPFTREELERHIGLKVNVFQETRKRFMKKEIDRLVEKIERELRDSKKEPEASAA